MNSTFFNVALAAAVVNTALIAGLATPRFRRATSILILFGAFGFLAMLLLLARSS